MKWKENFMKMKRVIALVLSVTMMASLAACQSSGASADSASGSASGSASASTSECTIQSVNEGTKNVTIGYVGTDEASYPSSSISNDFITQMMIYDKLFEVDDTTGEYVSRILDSYSWNDDNTQFTFTLKDGITFADGNQMTAEDVIFSFQNYINNGTTTDKYPYLQYIDFDACTADGLTGTIVYTQEYGPAENNFDICIMEKAFTEQHDESDEIWYTDPVGSGPYQITDEKRDSYITFTKRDDYWNSDYTYDCDQITLKFYTDETAMYSDYQSGELDAIYDISTTVADQINAASGTQGTVNYVSNNDCTLLTLNDSTEELQDANVREAIAYALDMDAIADIAYGSECTEAKSHFASTFDCYTEHDGYAYDPDKAKQILEDAGYKDGDITLDFVAVNTDPQPQIAEAVQGYLAAIGITVNVSSYDLGTALGMYIDNESDMSVFNVNGGNPTHEPYQTLSAVTEDATFVSMAIHDATFNEYLQTGLNTVDKDERNEAYEAADQWLYDNYELLPICETLSAYAYNGRIASFDQSSVCKGCLGSIKLK